MLSPLCEYIGYNPNYNKGPFEKDTVTIHHAAGNLSIKGYEATALSRKNSANYFIDSDGHVSGFVDESHRSWCSSNEANDKRAITIEVANCGAEPDWKISDKAYNALVNLLADICKRNPKIGRLRWKNDKSLVGKPAEQNMTVHQWFSATACPGPYLMDNMGEIAASVNKKLDSDNSADVQKLYRIQVGAFKSYENAKRFLESVELHFPDSFISAIEIPKEGEKK